MRESLATQFFKWTSLVLNDRWIYRVNSKSFISRPFASRVSVHIF